MGSVKKSGAKSGAMMGGRAGRFEATKAAAPGDYTDAFQSDFSKSKSNLHGKSKPGVGFGGSMPRGSAFDAAAAQASKNAPDAIYDVYSKTGAFSSTKAAKASGPSAAFASKSSKLSEAKGSDAPAPGAYNAYGIGSIAGSMSSKSFNKSVQNGAGGFGTSSKRVAMIGAEGGEEDAPGPGAYDATDGGQLFSRDTFKPSAAFASASAARPELRSSSAPTGVSYDPHKTDGVAATATKTFNSKAGTGGFGAQVPRQYHDVHSTAMSTPGPGEYNKDDPNAPTVDSKLRSTKGRESGSFASMSLRDTDDWNTMAIFNR